ncbi:MAG: DUF2207 domain-containing protein, partial [Vicinamibacterales bacterium]
MRLLFLLLFLLLFASSAHASSYTAERFDSRVEVMTGGSLRVTETMVFRFESGTFTRVFRTIPTRRTDGVEFISASMDNVPMPEGDGPGHVRRRRQNGVRIEWLFAPTGPSTHTFVLTYEVAGVAHRVDGSDVVAWRALPTEHAYRIEASRIEIVSPAQVLGTPALEMRRVGQYHIEQTGSGVAVEASAIGKNGWLEISLRFDEGSV